MASLGKNLVLITGISGFTGRNLAATLAREGWDIAGLGPDRLPVESDHLDADLADTYALAEWIAHVCPTHIVHLAALSNVVGDPLSFYRVNVLGTESLLNAIELAGLAPIKVLIASSANIYGNSDTSTLGESSPVRPMNHYALSKAAMELLVRKWYDRLPIVTTRPFNYTGPGQSESFLIPKIVASHLRRDAVIKLGNTQVARDFSDISVVCEAYRRLLESDAQGLCVNICSGVSTSIAEILKTMEEISGHGPRAEVDPALVRKDEVIELKGDPTLLHSFIGPLVPLAIREILERMYHHAGYSDTSAPAR
jgi:nucleoside-diphosphate-sugar epimerase